MSGDIKLEWSSAANEADVSIESNDLATDACLRTAVLISLFTDRRADDGDVLPYGETDRRGWWADAFPEVEGDRIGSRLWMLARSKATQDTLSRAEEYAAEALQWLVEDGAAEKVEAVATLHHAGTLGLEISIYRPQQKEPTRFRFENAWQAESEA